MFGWAKKIYGVLAQILTELRKQTVELRQQTSLLQDIRDKLASGPEPGMAVRLIITPGTPIH